MRNFVIALIVFITSVGTACASDDLRTLAEGETSPPASIESLGSLAGYWKGDGLGGVSEDLIAPAVGGQMMGMFRQSKTDGTLVFYEFYLFAEVEGSLELRIKHFNPDMTGWEEKDEYVAFPLVAVEDRAVYFDGVSFKMTGADEMRATVMVEGQGAIEFNFNRAD